MNIPIAPETDIVYVKNTIKKKTLSALNPVSPNIGIALEITSPKTPVNSKPNRPTRVNRPLQIKVQTQKNLKIFILFKTQK